jgi:hypothetical protein
MYLDCILFLKAVVREASIAAQSDKQTMIQLRHVKSALPVRPCAFMSVLINLSA